MTALNWNHAYSTTWTTPTDPEGPFAGEPGPDLEKPCPICGEPVTAHARMSLERLGPQKDRSTARGES